MTLREKKEIFISEIEKKFHDEKDTLIVFNAEKVIQGINSAIDCLIENEANEKDKPIVFVSHGMENKVALNLIKKFCINHYSNTNKEFFENSMLSLPKSSAEEALLELVDRTRCHPTLFYWADDLSWFKKLPSGTMHVIDFNHTNVIRGLNQQDQETITVNDKTYNNHNVNEDHFGLINVHQSTLDSIDGSLSRLFFEEAQNLIIRPIAAPIGCKYDDRITIDSPDWQKEACVALRRYQSRECGDGFNWDTSDNGWENVVVYPIVEDISMIDSQEARECLIGQVVMVTPENADPYLSTVWIHPFRRRQGRLSQLWQELKETYGSFQVEQPNANMRAFMDKNSDVS
ncbi:hypothetical protein [Shewanella algae]|uniref:hypothetical protein n=1 Tax=Shewanella algae TaxID=38313 RepID=UPI003AAC473A